MPTVNAAETVTAETSQLQQVLSLRRFGDTKGFELLDRAMPTAGPGEVRIRVLAASVQFTDLVMRQGKYPDLKQKPPVVLGYDVVGEIDQLGPGVTAFELGDRVADLTVTGSYARYRTLRADRLVSLPKGVEAAQAATLVLSWMTAYQLLHRHGKVEKGQRVLIHGAAGAVGQALLTLGALEGPEMWGTAPGPSRVVPRRPGQAVPAYLRAHNRPAGRGAPRSGRRLRSPSEPQAGGVRGKIVICP